MKKYLFFGFAILLVILSCEKEEENFISTNKIELSDFEIRDISYKKATLFSRIPNDVIDIDIIGHCWSKDSFPDISDNSTAYEKVLNGTITSNIVELDHNSTYFVRAYFKKQDVVIYGDIKSFKTLEIEPTSTELLDYWNLTSKSVSLNSIVHNFDTIKTDSSGFCWNTVGNPTVSGDNTIGNIVKYYVGYDIIVANISDLEVNTAYYFRSYAVNEAGISYSNQIEIKTTDGTPIIETVGFDEVTLSSLKIGGKIISSEGKEIIEKGICWNINGQPIIDDNIHVEGAGYESYISFIEGLTEGETYYFRAYAISSNGIGYGNELSVTLTEDYLSIKDIDGNWYNVVKIGNQFWLKENLKTTHYADGTAILDGSEIAYLNVNDKYWMIPTDVIDKDSYVDTYGLLYTWSAAINGFVGSNSNPSNIQGVCPDGWHIPSDSEWDELADIYGGGIMNVGGPLKDLGYEYWNQPNLGATNESGFTALPAGYRYDSPDYGDAGNSAHFWTSSEYVNNSDYAMYRACQSSYASLYHQEISKKSGFSVRCVKD